MGVEELCAVCCNAERFVVRRIDLLIGDYDV
jgi:hypothetical protein